MAYEKEKPEIPEDFMHLGEDFSKKIEMLSSESSSEKNPSLYYPELHFSGESAENLKKLPDTGTAVIHFKKIHESTRHENRDGKANTHHSVGIQIHGIKHVTEKQSAEKMTRHTAPKENPEDSIEKGLEAAESETSND